MRARAFAAREGAGSPRGLGRGRYDPGDIVGPGGIALHETDARVGGLDGGGIADHAGDFMATTQGFLDDAPADVPGGADDDDFHDTPHREPAGACRGGKGYVGVLFTPAVFRESSVLPVFPW